MPCNCKHLETAKIKTLAGSHHEPKCDMYSSDRIKEEPKEAVDKVSHYHGTAVMEFIDDFKLSFCLGNTVKYIARSGKKDPAKYIEDLKKAAWYLDWEIKRLEQEEKERANG